MQKEGQGGEEFIANFDTNEIHHGPFATEQCNLPEKTKSANYVWYSSLAVARSTGFDLCGHCFRSKDNE